MMLLRLWLEGLSMVGDRADVGVMWLLLLLLLHLLLGLGLRALLRRR